jgi:peptide/nickel transport system permease protein
LAKLTGITEEKSFKSESLWTISFRRMRKNRTAIAGIIILFIFATIAIFAPLIAPYDPLDQNFIRSFRPPSMENFLGTDEFGRDIFSRIIYGARISLQIGFCYVL